MSNVTQKTIASATSTIDDAFAAIVNNDSDTESKQTKKTSKPKKTSKAVTKVAKPKEAKKSKVKPLTVIEAKQSLLYKATKIGRNGGTVEASTQEGLIKMIKAEGWTGTVKIRKQFLDVVEGTKIIV